jgi:hypothetical protein
MNTNSITHRGRTMSFWEKLTKGSKKPSEPILSNVNYFVKGEDVVFDLNTLDFTFEGFYVFITDEYLQIQILEEVPMNLILVAGAAEPDVEVEGNELETADSVKFTLQLNDGLFASMKEDIFKQTDIRDVFALQLVEGSDGAGVKPPLRIFKNYHIVMWGTTQILEDE